MDFFLVCMFIQGYKIPTEAVIDCVPCYLFDLKKLDSLLQSLAEAIVSND